MSDVAVAIPDQGEANQNRLSHPPGKPPSMRRRVTDVPDANVRWFMEQDGNGPSISRELARAELTAQRDGYVIRWARPWVCQILEPDAEGGLIGSDWAAILDGTPDTDPRARETEQRLLREAGLFSDDEPGDPTSVERGEYRIVRRYASYHIFWEQCSVCQLFEPDGTTLIAQSDGWAVMDPATDPHARGIAADLLLEAGV